MAAEDPSVSGVSGRYATALFELARDEKSIDAVKADLDQFGAMLADSDDLKRLVRSPVFTADTQSKALAAVLDKAGISGISANFLKVLTANRRLFAVSDVIRAFNALPCASAVKTGLRTRRRRSSLSASIASNRSRSALTASMAFCSSASSNRAVA